MLDVNEALYDRMIKKRQQCVEVAGDMQDAVRLAVKAQLAPRPDFEEFLEAAQSAGEQHERIRERGHLLLPFVHRVHHAQLGDAAVPDFEIEQVLRNDSNDGSARRKNGISDDAHQADVPAAVDQALPFGGENCA